MGANATPHDRIERMVKQMGYKLDSACNGDVEGTVIALLRRELGKRDARVRRIVKRLISEHQVGTTRCVEDAEYDHTYRKACNDILAAIQRSKGKHG